MALTHEQWAALESELLVDDSTEVATAIRLFTRRPRLPSPPPTEKPRLELVSDLDSRPVPKLETSRRPDKWLFESWNRKSPTEQERTLARNQSELEQARIEANRFKLYPQVPELDEFMGGTGWELGVDPLEERERHKTEVYYIKWRHTLWGWERSLPEQLDFRDWRRRRFRKRKDTGLVTQLSNLVIPIDASMTQKEAAKYLLMTNPASMYNVVVGHSKRNIRLVDPKGSPGGPVFVQSVLKEIEYRLNPDGKDNWRERRGELAESRRKLLETYGVPKSVTPSAVCGSVRPMTIQTQVQPELQPEVTPITDVNSIFDRFYERAQQDASTIASLELRLSNLDSELTGTKAENETLKAQVKTLQDDLELAKMELEEVKKAPAVPATPKLSEDRIEKANALFRSGTR